VFTLPIAHGGPRRIDIDARGNVWVPAYAANTLLRLDPRTGKFDQFPLPLRDAVPYVVRVDAATGQVWVGTAAADAVLRFDPVATRFTVYALPSRGALIRHMAVDARRRGVWLAYGASPGSLPARIAFVRPE
jgi:streptogramin lyase